MKVQDAIPGNRKEALKLLKAKHKGGPTGRPPCFACTMTCAHGQQNANLGLWATTPCAHELII